MRFRLIVFIMLMLALVLSACNLGARPEREEELPTPEEPTPSARPNVTIVSPRSGDEFVVDEQILVSVTATDSVGVTRVQLFANGSIVKTVSSESTAGERNLPAVLDYTPRAAGTVNMQVLAFRGSVASEPAEIQVTVKERQQDVVVTSIPNPSVPQIPNDGVCRAMTNVGLNFRREPTTTQNNIIRTLAQGTLAPVIARLGDNSWWKISHGGNVGWVSAQFTTLSGNCQAIPVEQPLPTATPTLTRTPTPTLTPTQQATATRTNTPVPGRPDLVISSIVGEEEVTIPAGEDEVEETYTVVVTNTGLGPSSQFNVTLRIGTEVFDVGVVSGLDRGQSVTLTIDVIFDEPGTYDLRFDADPDNEVDEISNVNNRGDITVVVTAE